MSLKAVPGCLLLLMLCLTLHELGHFAVLSCLAVRVTELHIGIGPSWKLCAVRGTAVWLGALPLGGYTLGASLDQSTEGLPDHVEKQHTVDGLSQLELAAVDAGGIATNLLAAGALFWIFRRWCGATRERTGRSEAKIFGLFVWLTLLSFLCIDRLRAINEHKRNLLIRGCSKKRLRGAVALQLANIVWVSLLLFAVNLLPLPPLDGSRPVLRFAQNLIGPFSDEFQWALQITGLCAFVLLNFAYIERKPKHRKRRTSPSHC